MEKFNPEIREKIIIRLKKRHHFNDPNRDYLNEENIKTRFPDIKFDNYKETLNEIVPKTSIIIVTHIMPQLY